MFAAQSSRALRQGARAEVSRLTPAPAEGAHRQIAPESHLRYLPADRVRCGSPDLAGIVVRGRSDAVLGSLDGVILEAATRKLHYFVIHARTLSTDERYLLPFAFAGAQLDVARRAMRVDLDGNSIKSYERFETASFAAFCDDDVIAALFASRVVMGLGAD